MKWLAVSFTLSLLCGTIVAGGAQPAKTAAARAEAMYRVEQVAGVLLSAQVMYVAGDGTWHAGQLRVEQGT